MTDQYSSGTPAAQWGKASGPRAGFWRRFAAAIIDGIIVGVIEFVLDLIFRHGVGNYIGIVVSVAYFTVLEGGPASASLGMRALGIRIVDCNTGEPIGYPRAFVRWIGSILCTIPIFLGYFWMLWDKEKQCWNDKLAGDYCVPTADYPVISPGSGSSY